MQSGTGTNAVEIFSISLSSKKKVEMNIIHTSFAPHVAAEIAEDIGADQY